MSRVCDCCQGRLPCTCKITDADMARYAPDPYRKAVATMVRTESHPFGDRVVFHFKDGSTLAFKKTYEIEPS